MEQSKLPLNDISLFVEVGRLLNFSKAAEKTGIPHSTLSRRIKHLEHSIGLRLFHRTTRNIEFTEAGAEYFARCLPLIEQTRLAHEHINGIGTKPHGTLRAMLPIDLAKTWIAPLMPEFCQRYPELAFDFDLSSKPINLSEDVYDLIIKIGQQPDSSLVSRMIAKIPLYLYASPDYLDKYGEPETVEELEQRECLTIIYNTWTLYKADQSQQMKPTSRFKLNNLGMMHQLITMGLGIGLLPRETAAADLKAGKLLRIMDQWQGMDAPVYAITNSKLLPSKTRVFIEFLKEKFNTD
jgi:DNA-binding transcriptional LysR family regulator